MNKPAIQIIEFRIYLGQPIKIMRKQWDYVDSNVSNPAFSNKYCLRGMENVGWYNAALIRFPEPAKEFEIECERLLKQGFQAGTMTELAAMSPALMTHERDNIFAPGETSKGGSLNEQWAPKAFLHGEKTSLSWSVVDCNTLQRPIWSLGLKIGS